MIRLDTYIHLMSNAFTHFKETPPVIRMTYPKPKCPNCGTDDLMLVGSQDMYMPGGERDQKSPTVKITVHRCRCGTAFTETGTPPQKAN